MRIFSLYILNKAGGLVFQKDVNPGLLKLSANDYLVLAGTLHSVHAIATKLKPTVCKTGHEDSLSINSRIITTGKASTPNLNNLGLQHVDTDFFSLYVFQTLTGIKFVIVTSPAAKQDHLLDTPVASKGELRKQYELVEEYFKQFYILYCDYVMKDPFYSIDMPIKSALFEDKVKTTCGTLA